MSIHADSRTPLRSEDGRVAAQRRELLAQLLEEEGLAQRDTIARRTGTGSAPLSYAQQRIWFLDRLNTGSTAYRVQGSVTLTGPLNLEALRQAIDIIVVRHEALRTTFHAGEEEPIQVIHEPGPASLSLVDLSALPELERAAECNRLLRQIGERPFDLENGPLFRAHVTRIAPVGHLLTVAMHHIISDGWSLQIFLRELGQLYGLLCQGVEPKLPLLHIQYADFACWQREWLQGEMMEQQVAYWRRQLGGTLTQLELPRDHPRPQIQGFRGARQSLALTSSVVQALNGLSRERRATLFMTMLAAFQVLLARLTGQEDILVGTPVSGRNRLESEDLIGFFIQTIVLRSDLSGDPIFLELLDQVRETTLAAQAHQDVPFEKLVEELHPQRDLSRTPIFQVLFNMVNVPAQEPVNAGGLQIGRMLGSDVESKFDLTVYVVESEGEVVLDFLYNPDLFDQPRIAEMVRQYRDILTQISERPEARIGSLSLVSHEARPFLPDASLPISASWYGAIQERISRQAARSPHRLAIVDSHDRWTYEQLEKWSNRLAHHLRSVGIGKADVVAIYVPRSTALVWALLGVLKSGAAFVILDPSHPTTYVLDCLRACAPKGWIQSEWLSPPAALMAFASELPDRRRMQLPSCGSANSCDWLRTQPVDPPPVHIEPEDIAYVAFTSGSSGKPKGVVGSHRPLSHFFHWHTQTFGFSPDDRFSMLSGLSHDPLLRDIFTPLCVGASLHVPRLAEISNFSYVQSGPAEQATGTWNKPTIRRLVEHLHLRSNRPKAESQEFRSLHDAERRKILYDWNDTARSWSGPQCLVKILEAQVERTPTRIAAAFGSVGLSYTELNARANRLAHLLRSAGVAPDVLVGICLERSLDMLVAVLAVLKAGGAYLPLDAEYPQERLEFMLRDSAVPVVITQHKLLHRVAGNRQTICMDRDRVSIGQQAASNPLDEITASNMAYVIYTSGSTGRPKGTVISRSALLNLLLSMRETLDISADDVLLAVTTLSFDIATLEMLLPLIVGARVEIAKREQAIDPVQLGDRISETGATVMQATPATWHMLVECGWKGNSRLKVLSGGEALPRALANTLEKTCASVWNLYGPTETTIYSAAYRVQTGSGAVPIGKPIANTQTYVLDERMQPVAVGVTGELYIGGAGLALGYLNQPKLTAEKFLPSPFGGDGARIYRTGDLARYRDDGVVQYLGRVDTQVKMRGYRIELGEIEVALAEHPGIRQAVVAAREDGPGDKRLVAYVIPAQPRPQAADLRAYLQKRLPEYMVPSIWILLDAFPLTPNGKVDRGALPGPAMSGNDGYSDPRTIQQGQKRLAEWLCSEKITVLHCTPPFLDLLAESQRDKARKAAVPSLRYAFFAGDCLLPRQIVLLRSLAPSVSCVNFYGTTETPQAMSFYVVPGSAPQQEQVPIGHGIEGVQLLVLNRAGEIAGAGELGEIYVRTPYLANGYLEPQDSVLRFLPNHFTNLPGDQLFRTGDLGRYLPDGNVMYCGRIDDQVKIRGYRVELQHVESLIAAHPSVLQCVVAIRQHASGDKRLVAYFVPKTGNGQLDGRDLQAYVKQHLPAYMVPSVFVPVNQIPLTANGKIDRTALPEPNASAAKTTYVPPRNRLEQQLVQIWEKVLNVSPVGIMDNFFDMGGHSLLAVRLFTAIEKAFNRSLPIATIFQAPTIERFAAVLEQNGWAAPYSALVPIKSQGSAPPFFCVHSLGANLVSYGALAHRIGEDQPFYGLQPRGLDGKQAPHTRIEEMAAHYVAAIRNVQQHGPYYLGGVCLGGVIAFEMAQQLLSAGEKIAALVLMDSYCPGTPRHLPSRTLDYGFLEQMDWYIGETMLLPLPEKIKFVFARAKGFSARFWYSLRVQLGRTVRAVAPKEAQVERIMAHVKAVNSQAWHHYVPRPYPGKIILFWCSEIPTRCYRDRRLAWSEITDVGLEVHAIPGDHMTMVEPPHVEVLAETLRKCLQRAQQGTEQLLSTPVFNSR